MYSTGTKSRIGGPLGKTVCDTTTMFDSIRTFFDTHLGAAQDLNATRGQEHELQLAAAALLLEVMHADYDVMADELDGVRDALQTAFELDSAELDELIELASQERDAAVGYYQFTRSINDQLSPERKAEIVELMWRVAYADGSLDRYEEHVVRRVADLLYVPHSVFIQTKLRVADSLSAS